MRSGLKRWRGARWASLTGLWLVAACGGPSQRSLTVLAASSLTEGFGDLAASFERRHSDVEVRLVLGGSQAMATQVRHGLRADVFASAHRVHLDGLVDEGLLHSWRPFAGNRLVVSIGVGVARLGSAEGVQHIERLVLGAPEVPAGAYADAFIEQGALAFGSIWADRVVAHTVSREPNVRLSLAKVLLGEADAAVVYATDAQLHPSLGVLELPVELSPAIAYGQGRLNQARDPALAEAWLEWVRSDQGQSILAQRGFVEAP